VKDVVYDIKTKNKSDVTSKGYVHYKTAL